MTPMKATITDRVLGCFPTDDGRHVLFQLSGRDGQFFVAMPSGELFTLMALSSRAASTVHRMTLGQAGGEHVFSCEDVSVRQGNDRRGIVLTATVPGGMQVKVELSAAQALTVQRDLLQAALDGTYLAAETESAGAARLPVSAQVSVPPGPKPGHAKVVDQDGVPSAVKPPSEPGPRLGSSLAPWWTAKAG
jgi:hypothetical protein